MFALSVFFFFFFYIPFLSITSDYELYLDPIAGSDKRSKLCA